MDCNRDEAARSMSIAEKKFTQHDYAGARKFALKARQLFPDLDGLMQFIAVAEVHATAYEKLQSGEMDWYGILQSDPSADESSLRKQYRKLALILHPDKNKSLGAEAAFKYISEAWTILSDQTKKAAYDIKRNPPASKPVPVKKSVPAPQSKQPENQPPRRKQTQKPPATACQPQPQPPHHAFSAGTTFWTACPDCKLQYEYQIVYKHKNLCCPFCLKPFLAKELAVVMNGTVLWPPLQEHNRVKADTRGGPFGVNGYSSGAKSNASPGNPERPQVNSEARKENIDHISSASKEQLSKNEMDQLKSKSRGATAEASDPLVAKRNVLMEHKLSTNNSSEEGCEVAVNACTMDTMENPKASTEDGCLAPTEKEGGRMDIPFADLELEPDLSPSKKARLDPQVSIQEEVLKGISKTQHSETGCKEENGNHVVASGLKAKTSVGSLNQETSTPGNHISNSDDTEMDCLVPDSDFYVFDSDRTEQHFASGQVWACYDDDDGFPRYYARVVKVMSQKPFKLQYTWLEARSSSEEVMSWLDSGFSYTCGEFKLGKTLTGESVCMFSHMMTFEKGQKGGFTILPRKGEVWALYKDWASLNTKDDKHGYELVEVLTDYSDEIGVQVCLLAKVQGYKSVYQQLSGVAFEVLPQQMRRFSHNIPVHRLNAGEIPHCTKGSLELDPASTPVK